MILVLSLRVPNTRAREQPALLPSAGVVPAHPAPRAKRCSTQEGVRCPRRAVISSGHLSSWKTVPVRPQEQTGQCHFEEGNRNC